MKQRTKNPLTSFHEFVGQQLSSASAAQMTPERALQLWREREETLEAIREGLEDVEEGRLFSAEEVIRELRVDLE